MAPVVQKLDNAIHWIAQLVSLTLNRWIVIYLVDSAIQRLNNWSLAIILSHQFLKDFLLLSIPVMAKFKNGQKVQSPSPEPLSPSSKNNKSQIENAWAFM